MPFTSLIVPMLTKLANFFQILDRSQRVSITNLTIFAVLAKILAEPHAAWPEIVALGVALANYVAKKVIEHKKDVELVPPAEVVNVRAELKALREELTDLKGRVSSVSLHAGIKAPRRPGQA